MARAVSDSLIASNRPSINKDPTGNYHVGFECVRLCWSLNSSTNSRSQTAIDRTKKSVKLLGMLVSKQ